MKKFISGMLVMYVATAVLFSLASVSVMPKAMNTVGHIFYGMFWPAWPISAMVDKTVIDIPEWAFTFDDAD